MHRASWGSAAGKLLLLLTGSGMLFSRVNADVSFEGSIPTNIEMGTSYTVQWQTDADSVRVTLISGSEDNDDIFALYDIVCGIWIVNNLSQACNSTDSSIDWTPADDLPVGHYMLMANDADGSTAYSNQFNLAKAEGGSSSQSTATSTTATGTTGTTGSTGTTTTSGSTPTSGSSLTTSDVTSVSGSSETSSVPSDTASGGLSTGAKAGIGVGAAIGGLALLGGLGFLIFRMGKRSADEKKKAKDESVEGGAADGKAGGDSKPEESQPGSADAAAVQADKLEEGGLAELQAPVKIHEAPDYKTRLDTPGKREFVSELDATGGSFVIPQTTRPNTGDTGALENADKDKDKENAASDGEGEGEVVKKESEATASESKDRASTSSGKPKSVIYETPDDIGRPEDK